MSVWVCACICMFLCMCIYVRVCVIHTHTYTQIHTHTHTHTHIHTHTHTQSLTHTHAVSMCVCKFRYAWVCVLVLLNRWCNIIIPQFWEAIAPWPPSLSEFAPSPTPFDNVDIQCLLIYYLYAQRVSNSEWAMSISMPYTLPTATTHSLLN